MKYNLGVQTVEAVYDNSGTQNPLIEALPGCLDVAQFERQIKCCPLPPQACQSMSMAERRQGLALLPTVFIPLDYMYYIYDSLYRMLQSSYQTLTSRERPYQCPVFKQLRDRIWGPGPVRRPAGDARYRQDQHPETLPHAHAPGGQP